MSTLNRKKARRQGSFLLPKIMCESVNKGISRSFSGAGSLIRESILRPKYLRQKFF